MRIYKILFSLFLRKRFLSFPLTISFMTLATPPFMACALGNEYPEKTIRWVVPTPAGTSIDIAARLVAQPLRESLGQVILIDNKPGAGGTIGAMEVARSAPDGYTYFVGFNGPLVTAPLLSGAKKYNPQEIFSPVVATVSLPHVLAISGSSSAHSLSEFVALVKTQHDRFNYASVGQGSASHLAMELFKSRVSLKLSHVPFNGGPAATQALMMGDVQALFSAYINVKEFAASRRLQILALAQDKRSNQAPEVPTFKELGFPSIEAPLFNALVAPTKTPESMIRIMNREIRAVLDRPTLKETLSASGMDVMGGAPQDLKDLLLSETKRWEPLIRQLGLSEP
jgi:hypothetical protein